MKVKLPRCALERCGLKNAIEPDLSAMTPALPKTWFAETILCFEYHCSICRTPDDNTKRLAMTFD